MEIGAVHRVPRRSVVSPWLSTTSLTPVSDTFTSSTAAALPVLRGATTAPDSLSPLVTTAASMFSLAFLAVPQAALAQSAASARPPAAGLSTIVKTPEPPPKSDAPPQPEVPWYNSIEQRAHDINDGFGGFRSGVDAYKNKLNETLNDNALAKYHTEGQVGDYHWTFKGMHADVDPYVTLRANKIGAGVRGEVSLLQGVMQTTRQDGDWSRTQGVRADLYGRLEVGQGASLKLNGIQPDAPRNHFAGPRVEVFQQWNLTGDHDWKVTADFNAGASYDVTGTGAITYLRGLQRFENDQLTRKWLGEGSHVRFEAEEGVQYNLQDGQTRPYYRVFGGVGKPVTIHFRGKEHMIDVETGLRAQGTKEEPFKVRPEVRARVHW